VTTGDQNREYIESNRRHWDELVPIHLRSEFYAGSLNALRAGRSRLHPPEREELLPVRGMSLLHLQCHFGLDSMSLALEGAEVTGVDFSTTAIETATKLSKELGIPARFEVSEVTVVSEVLRQQFDIVFTSYGVLCWLPDLRRWAEVVVACLKPGGTFYIAEFHPMQQTLVIAEDDPAIDELKIRYPYFATPAPQRYEDTGTYADPTAEVKNRAEYIFPHSLGDIVTSLLDAGLRLEFLHEFPYSKSQFLPFLEESGDGTYRLTKGEGTIPLMFSIKATRPA
jgi:2-polyprenyl-3-methyl-5-hydroxy-6-metoxy-1,4-benzoquinol methylase